jgi:hypothetical protein
VKNPVIELVPFYAMKTLVIGWFAIWIIASVLVAAAATVSFRLTNDETPPAGMTDTQKFVEDVVAPVIAALTVPVWFPTMVILNVVQQSFGKPFGEPWVSLLFFLGNLLVCFLYAALVWLFCAGGRLAICTTKVELKK